MTTRKKSSKKKSAASISDEAVKSKTGKTWRQWFVALDLWGAQKKTHQEIARYLKDERSLSGWWSQQVTVTYEKARGLREPGQASKGWQTQAQKTLAADPEAVWTTLVKPAVRNRWLGSKAKMRLTEGSRYTLEDGTQGEVRAVRPPKLLRLTWEPTRGKKSTLEVTVARSGESKAAVRFRHHGLGAKKDLEPLRKRWKAALDVLAEKVVK